MGVNPMTQLQRRPAMSAPNESKISEGTAQWPGRARAVRHSDPTSKRVTKLSGLEDFGSNRSKVISPRGVTLHQPAVLERGEASSSHCQQASLGRKHLLRASS